MSDENQEQEIAPPTRIEKIEAKRAERAPEDAGLCLIFNERPSVANYAHFVPIVPRTKDEKEEFERFEVRLLPGLNFVDAGVLDALEEHNPKAAAHMKERCLVFRDEKSDGLRPFRRRPADDRLRMIVSTASLSTLKKIRVTASDDAEIAALDDEIEILEERSKRSGEQRREARRARRKGPRRI